MITITPITFSSSPFVMIKTLKKQKSKCVERNKKILKIFFPNYYWNIDDIFHPNKLVFTTLPLKSVNEYQSSQLAYKILESALRKPCNKNVHYLKSCRDMICNHHVLVKIIFDEVFVNFNMFGLVICWTRLWEMIMADLLL